MGWEVWERGCEPRKTVLEASRTLFGETFCASVLCLPPRELLCSDAWLCGPFVMVVRVTADIDEVVVEDELVGGHRGDVLLSLSARLTVTPVVEAAREYSGDA